jgi:hypothetical protein
VLTAILLGGVVYSKIHHCLLSLSLSLVITFSSAAGRFVPRAQRRRVGFAAVQKGEFLKLPCAPLSAQGPLLFSFGR